jgi:phage portal protein BeeE
MATTLRERLARLFGLEAKASRTAKLIAWAAGGQPVWTPRDLASLAREGFAKNAVVYRSVRMIAEAAASVPLFLFDGESEVDEQSCWQSPTRHTARLICSRPGTGICSSPGTLSRGRLGQRHCARAACASPRPHEGGAWG